jgi:hypothetical protein
MAKQSKKDKRVIVNEVYFELVERKSQLLERIFKFAGDGEVIVHSTVVKDYLKIQKEWDKVEADLLDGSELYDEPPAAD